MINTVSKIWSFDAAARKRLLRAIFWTFLFKFCEVIPEILIALMINLAILKEKSFLVRSGFASDLSTIYLLAATILLAFVMSNRSQFFGSLEFKAAARIVHYRLKMKLCQYILFHKEEQLSAEHETVIGKQRQKSHEIDTIEFFMSRTLEDFFRMLFSSLIIGSILFAIGPKFLLYVIIPLPPTFIIAMFLQKKIHPHYDKIKQATKEMHYQIDELINCLPTIRDFCIEKRFFQKVESKAFHLNQMRETISHLNSALSPVTAVFIQLCFLLVLIHGALMIFHNQITIGAFIATIFLSRKFLQSFAFLGGLVDNCRRGIKACQEINFQLNQKALPLHQESHQNPSSLGPIVLKELSYSHGDKKILRGINFEFQFEGINVIKGGTGTGKTTLFRLLMREFSSDSGEILYGTSRIDSCSLVSWRKAIAIVPQYPTLFKASIRDNISLFAPDLDQERFLQAIEISLTTQFIELLPRGIHSVVGTNGIRLSGGQIRSIALARALYANPKILLLDEPTAAFDLEREKLFLEGLKNIKKGRTVIITSHSQNIINAADHVLEIGL